MVSVKHSNRSSTRIFRPLRLMLHSATDLMALTKLAPPSSWGCDIAVGSAQRFGVPMGFGGPHAGFLSTSDKYSRKMPGRIIGVTIDSEGKPCLRMAMQTREQVGLASYMGLIIRNHADQTSVHTDHSTFEETRPRQIYVQHRRCWQIWQHRTRYTMARKV